MGGCLEPLGAGGALEAEGAFGVYIEHVIHYDGSPDRLRFHVPRLGSALGCDMGHEQRWDDRLREAVRAAAAAVALGLLDGPQS